MCLHGFTGTWRAWELVLQRLEPHHDTLALTLPGHAGGPPLPADPTVERLLDGVEAAMDAAGFAEAHLVGNSLGGYLALRLAARGRACSVVALAPAGGWALGDRSQRVTLAQFVVWQRHFATLAPRADAIARSPSGRRQVTQALVSHGEHLPADWVAHQILATVACRVRPLVEVALRDGFPLDPEGIRCPVRIVWGTADRLLPWPTSAHRYRHEWLPDADWVELPGIGHCPQLEVPLEAAELILGFTSVRRGAR